MLVVEVECDRCHVLLYGVGELPMPFFCDQCIMELEEEERNRLGDEPCR